MRAKILPAINLLSAIALLTGAQVVLTAPVDTPPLSVEVVQRQPIMLAQASSRAENRGMVQLMNQLDGLNRELSKLRGKIEELNNSIQNAEKRQKDMYLDLDTRLRRIEQSNTESVAESKSMSQTLSTLQERVGKLEQSSNSADGRASQPQTLGGASDSAIGSASSSADVASSNRNADATRAYEQAMSKYRAGDYQDAIDAFQVLAQQFPNHPLAINAQYWTGDAYYQLRAYRSAIDAQKKLIATYPNSEKAPDAMLNIGSAYLGLGDADSTRKIWEQLVADFPASRAAGKASARLERLR